jgi:hypothetical protein
MMATAEFNIFADFNQFLVCSEGADWDDLYEKWSPTAVEEMIVCGTDYIAVGTARPAHVPVIIRIVDTPPPPDTTAQLVHECEIVVNADRVEITGVTDNGMSGGFMEARQGLYNARVSYYDLNSVDESGLQGRDRYTVELWPTSALSQ